MAVFVGHKCPTYNNCVILFTKMSASRRRAIAHLVSGCLSNAIPKGSLKKKNRLVFSQAVFLLDELAFRLPNLITTV